MSGEVEKCQILHVRPKFDVFTLCPLFYLPIWSQKLCIQIDVNRFSDFLFTLQSEVGNPPLRSCGELTSHM